jgi:plasmid maintenance system killer protein
MNIDFGNNKLKKQFSNATEIKKTFGEMARKVAQRMQEMSDASTLAVLMQIPAANCHPLKGDRMGQWAVFVSPNHRLLFEINHKPVPLKADGSVDTTKVTGITIIATADYHHH